jgi:hypothetical protein
LQQLTVTNLIEDINMGELQGLFFWGFLLAFGAAMYLLVPQSKDEAGFFHCRSSFSSAGFFLPLALPRYRITSAGSAA